MWKNNDMMLISNYIYIYIFKTIKIVTFVLPKCGLNKKQIKYFFYI